MIVAHHGDDRLHILDRLRERVALASGLRSNGQLDQDAASRAIDCLRRFAERLRGIPASHIRVVGTNTFRKVNDGGQFMHEAESAIEHSIEILGGAEEARLVYLGVRYDVGELDEPMLAVDIGGGSTELAYGAGSSPSITESIQTGCVTWTSRFFQDGRITSRRMYAAILAAKLELEPVMHRFAQCDVNHVIASSGTALALEEIGIESGWTKRGIDRSVLEHIRANIVDAGHAEAIDLDGLSESRRPVVAGGVAILTAVFDAIDPRLMRTSRCALREGVLIDMLGRIAGDDRRERSVLDLAKHGRIDQAQSNRVSSTVHELFQVVCPSWKLDDSAREFLHWAATLHEIGMGISHTDYHRHGAYIVEHADLPGFSRTDQEKLAAIIRLHRKRISDRRIPDFDKATRHFVRDVALLLRLGVRLHRSRTDAGLSHVQFESTDGGLHIRIDQQQAEMNPLTMEDLRVEAEHWARMKRTLECTTETRC